MIGFIIGNLIAKCPVCPLGAEPCVACEVCSTSFVSDSPTAGTEVNIMNAKNYADKKIFIDKALRNEAILESYMDSEGLTIKDLDNRIVDPSK